MITQKQINQLDELAAIANEAGLNALDNLDKLIERLSKAKTLANNCRWRMGPLTSNEDRQVKIKYVDQETNAEGFILVAIKEVFYPPAHAARYLNTNTEKIMNAIAAQQLYSLIIEGVHVIPQKSLEICKNLTSKD